LPEVGNATSISRPRDQTKASLASVGNNHIKQFSYKCDGFDGTSIAS